MSNSDGREPKQSKYFGQILRLVTQTPSPMTMKQIAGELGVSLPTAYQGVNALTEAGLVRSFGTQTSSGGRRPASIGINAAARIALGISITGSSINTLACDLRGHVLYSTFMSANTPSTPAAFRDAIQAEIDRFLSATSFSRRLLLGTVVAIPGIVNTTDGIIEHAPVINLTGAELASLTNGLTVPTSIANDALCGGYAEVLESDIHRSLAYLSLERGVGGAFFIEGTPYHGMHGRAAEFGHLCVEMNGEPCSCGKRGCLEAYCSSAALERSGRMPLPQFFSMLAGGDEASRNAWDAYAEHLARGIVTISTALDCDVILGGTVAQYLAPHLADIRQRVHALHPFPQGAGNLLLGTHPHDGIPLGAARMLVSEFIGNA